LETSGKWRFENPHGKVFVNLNRIVDTDAGTNSQTISASNSQRNRSIPSQLPTDDDDITTR
jgi:hypothetical protein